MWHVYLFYAVGLILLVSALIFLRWFLRKPRRMRVPVEMFEAISEFAEQFQHAADNMATVAESLTLESRIEWERKSSVILKNLRQMNRMLRRLNGYFDEERRQSLRTRARDTELGDFSDPQEAGHFDGMEPIQPDEREGVDWDDVFS